MKKLAFIVSAIFLFTIFHAASPALGEAVTATTNEMWDVSVMSINDLDLEENIVSVSQYATNEAAIQAMMASIADIALYTGIATEFNVVETGLFNEECSAAVSSGYLISEVEITDKTSIAAIGIINSVRRYNYAFIDPAAIAAIGFDAGISAITLEELDKEITAGLGSVMCMHAQNFQEVSGLSLLFQNSVLNEFSCSNIRWDTAVVRI